MRYLLVFVAGFAFAMLWGKRLPSNATVNIVAAIEPWVPDFVPEDL